MNNNLKFTKKQSNELIESIKNDIDSFGWRLWMAGVYLKDNRLSSFKAYHGEGLDENVYNERYEEIYYVTDVIKEHLDGYVSFEDTVSSVYEYVQDFIDGIQMGYENA